ALCVNRPVDVLLVHDAPAGIPIEKYRRSDWVSAAAGLDRLVYRLRPPRVVRAGRMAGGPWMTWWRTERIRP
ncbi:MAG TPA: hypothetical protein VF730_15120, partial [Terracidiphilus sp.]